METQLTEEVAPLTLTQRGLSILKLTIQNILNLFYSYENSFDSLRPEILAENDEQKVYNPHLKMLSITNLCELEASVFFTN